VATTFTGVQVSQLDDNLIPGGTYTFQFKSNNLIWQPSNETLAAEIEANAPSFISSLNITAPPLLSRELYNAQFTYSGDGTDVVSDVAASIIAAAKASGDDIVFTGAAQAPTSAVVVNLSTTANVIEQSAASAASKVLTDATAAAGAAVKQASSDTFSAILPWLIGAVVVILVLLPSISKAGLIPKVTTG
jgi:hypothetical protein